jgi:hypothetical protein
MVTITEVEKVFKDIFQEEEGKVASVETVYEHSKSKDFYKYKTLKYRIFCVLYFYYLV